jgi:hypothetical protein
MIALFRGSCTDERHHPSTLEFGEEDHIYLCGFSNKGVVIPKLITFAKQDVQVSQSFSRIFSFIFVIHLTKKAQIVVVFTSLESLSFRKSRYVISFKEGGLQHLVLA